MSALTAIRPTLAQEPLSAQEPTQEVEALAERLPVASSPFSRQTQRVTTRLAQPRPTAAAATRLTVSQKRAKAEPQITRAVSAETRSREAAREDTQAHLKVARQLLLITAAKTAKPIAEAGSTAAARNGGRDYAAAPSRPTTAPAA